MKHTIRFIWIILAFLALAAGCQDAEPETAVTAVPPTPTSPAIPTLNSSRGTDFIVIATDAPNGYFADFDPLGNVIGFDNDLMARIAAIADFDYEFLVTPHEGVLENLISPASHDYDIVMSSLVIPDEPEPGIAYTVPYLEIGQVMVVLADEQDVQSYADFQAGMAVGVPANSSSEETARQILALSDADVFEYDTAVQALQALIDESVNAVIVDNFTAEHYTTAYPEQLKILGGTGRDAWISQKSYGIAVPTSNPALLDRLNQAILQAQDDQTIERLTTAWIVPSGSIDAGESRVGTPAGELVIGMVGQFSDMDPASDPDLIGWEIKNNTMSGLYGYNSSNQLVPLLAANMPIVSEDKLEYTIPLRRNLSFPDGSEFTAEDVQWAISRSARLGSFLVNSYLKDSNDDNFADEDAVQVVDPYTVKIVLQEPAAYFPSLLATPPYYPVSSACYNDTADPLSTCGGIGPYTIVSWEVGERIRLKANPEWPGLPAPAFENIQVRFYTDVPSLLRSLTEFQSVDLAWTGLPFADYQTLAAVDQNSDGEADYVDWQGPAIFKSYLMFNHDTKPWDNARVRQAAALALDREALAALFDGLRLPLYSPVPDAVPGHVATFPQRDLAQAVALLLQAGYSTTKPLLVTLTFVNDGRYSPIEETYATAIKIQLEETGVFQVTLQGTSWEVLRGQISQCDNPFYLIGWPSPGQPVNYLDVTSWTDFFVQNTDTGFCSNYESAVMTKLVEEANTELDEVVRTEDERQIQLLWATDLPTLDLTQEIRYAIGLPKVDNVRIDALGLLHYEVLTKSGG
ncbi:MAG: transporter substrate-binding domain-containing protein [Ardenticatenaceae bacterium]|nr:transporter substrate-binding domain-containing protein [Ardenticatenaceae bacterium]MCB9446161.1 transporter substrate-binding domain-containing protein [Ardenticatenaceae bacterium]